MEPLMLISIIVVGLFAGTFGAVVGSSLLVIVPALIFFGIPPHIALGTGKLSALFRDVPALINYHKGKKIAYKIAFPFSITMVIGTVIGAFVTLSLSEDVLKKVISIFMIVAIIFILFNPKLGLKAKKIKITKKSTIISLIAGLVCGFYAGIFGGGITLFMILSFVIIAGLDFLGAVATTKVPGMFSMITFVIIFGIYQKIDYIVAIPLVLSMVIGGYIGSKIALKKGNNFIRWLFILIVFIMAIKLLFFS